MRNRPSVLTWIIAFKAVKTTILTAVGVGLLTARHADPVDVLLRLALAFHLPLTSRLLNPYYPKIQPRFDCEGRGGR